MNLFNTLRIPEAQRYCIRQARVPTCFLPDGAKTLDHDGATLVDLLVDNDRIAEIEPAGAAASGGLPAIDLGSRHVWPTLIDMHANLDKGHIVARAENPDGSFAGPLQSTIEDRTRRWTAEDIKRRMEFGLRCAYVHGVAAIAHTSIHWSRTKRSGAERYPAGCGPSGPTVSSSRPWRWCQALRRDAV
jgi:cytosine deaminase